MYPITYEFRDQLSKASEQEISYLLMEQESYLKKRIDLYYYPERPPDEHLIGLKIEAYKARLKKDSIFQSLKDTDWITPILQTIIQEKVKINNSLNDYILIDVKSSTEIEEFKMNHIVLNAFENFELLVESKNFIFENYLNNLADQQFRLIEECHTVRAINHIFRILFLNFKERYFLFQWFKLYYFNSEKFGIKI